MSPNVSQILAYSLEEQSDGAGFLDRMNDMGTVDIGKNADLVLLGANPIESVQNLYGINAVIRAGAYHDNQKLSSIKERLGTK